MSYTAPAQERSLASVKDIEDRHARQTWELPPPAPHLASASPSHLRLLLAYPGRPPDSR